MLTSTGLSRIKHLNMIINNLEFCHMAQIEVIDLEVIDYITVSYLTALAAGLWPTDANTLFNCIFNICGSL